MEDQDPASSGVAERTHGLPGPRGSPAPTVPPQGISMYARPTAPHRSDAADGAESTNYPAQDPKRAGFVGGPTVG